MISSAIVLAYSYLFLLNSVFRVASSESDYDSVSPSLLIWIRYFKKLPKNHKNHKKMLPKNSGAQFLLFQKSVQSIGLLIILIFTFSISHRQCKTYEKNFVVKQTHHDVSIPHRQCKTEFSPAWEKLESVNSS